VPCTFRVLGPLGVVVDGIDITPRAPKERSLLALLLMRAGEIVSADQLIELWPDLDVERARRVLWVRLAGLRAALRRVGADDALASMSAGYRLVVWGAGNRSSRMRTGRLTPRDARTTAHAGGTGRHR
jgi:DNA-binding SARP family transcriptional activator